MATNVNEPDPAGNGDPAPAGKPKRAATVWEAARTARS
jgi:hypothetical protein